MQRQRRLKLAAVLVAMAMAAGCAATLLMGVGGLAALGTYKWVEGTMEKDYPRPMQETFNATKEAATKLNLKISSELVHPLGVQDPGHDPGWHLGQGGTDRPAQRHHHRQDPLRHDGQRRLVGLLPPPDHEDFANPGPAIKAQASTRAARTAPQTWPPSTPLETSQAGSCDFRPDLRAFLPN